MPDDKTTTPLIQTLEDWKDHEKKNEAYLKW